MDSMDSAIVSLTVIFLFGAILLKRKKSVRAARRCWVNPYLLERASKGRFAKDVIYTTHKINYTYSPIYRIELIFTFVV